MVFLFVHLVFAGKRKGLEAVAFWFRYVVLHALILLVVVLFFHASSEVSLYLLCVIVSEVEVCVVFYCFMK